MRIRSAFRSAFFSAAIIFVLVASTLAQTLPAIPSEGLDAITPTELRMHLSFLASDELGGRYTISEGNRVAARYLASRLQSYGFHPAKPGGDFLQKIPMLVTETDPNQVSFAIDGKPAKYASDYLYSSMANTADATAETVFVGYGVSSPENKYDDYASVDVKGKIVVMSLGMPTALEEKTIPEKEQGEFAAAAHGAIGVIQISSSSRPDPWNYYHQLYVGEHVSVIHPGEIPEPVSNLPVIIAREHIGERLLQGAAKNLKDLLSAINRGNSESMPLKHSVTIHAKTRREKTFGQNVVGILDGSDPQLKKEYVAFSAHYDHLKTINGQIFNGADDDGSGTSAVLNIARAFSLTHPKRSILVIFHTGEELGLYGSEYFTDYEPLVPLNQIVTDLNIDMVGRVRAPDDKMPGDRELSDFDSIYLIGADRLSSELNGISEATNREIGKMHLNYKYNDPRDPNQFYERSDHFNYAKHGIPVIFYFTGEHVDYHKPSDKVEKINFDKMARVAKFVYATGWRVANMDHRLEVDNGKKAAGGH